MSPLSSLRIVLVAAGLCALVLTPAQTEAEELTVYNNAPFVQVTGPWASATLTDGSTRSDYLFRPASAGDATVFWPFPATTSLGHYGVFARWTSGPDRATNALYWVSSDAGTVSITQNQQVNGGTWQSLGSFDFQPGLHEGVTLWLTAGDPTMNVDPDLVRLLKRPRFGPLVPTLRGRLAPDRRAEARGSGRLRGC